MGNGRRDKGESRGNDGKDKGLRCGGDRPVSWKPRGKEMPQGTTAGTRRSHGTSGNGGPYRDSHGGRPPEE